MAAGQTPTKSGMALALRNASSTPRRRRASCKCLFGVPDREESRRLIIEQNIRDRKRFIRRFNFDIETECAYKAAKLDSPVKFDDCASNSSSPRTAMEALSSNETELRLLASPSRSGSGSPRTPRTPRTPRGSRTPRTPRTPASRRQLQMTDYWTSRKRADSASDKEN